MTTLDCTNVESSLASLAAIAGATPREVRLQLESFDFSAYCDERPNTYPDYQGTLARQVFGSLDSVPVVDATLWFHATRIVRDVPFAQEGLLPLKDCFDSLWEQVSEIVSTLGIAGVQATSSPSYVSKLARLGMQGPCAFLLREAALGKSKRQCRFIDTPEIVIDFARDLAGERAEEVLSEYRTRTAPCVVTFRSREPRPDAVECALAYCHAAIWDDDDPLGCNTCFDGRGTAVPASDILNVEWF